MNSILYRSYFENVELHNMEQQVPYTYPCKFNVDNESAFVYVCIYISWIDISSYDSTCNDYEDTKTYFSIFSILNSV